MKTLFTYLASLIVALPTMLSAYTLAGVGKTDLTPPVGTPSAGYADRGVMIGVHDPLLATALYLDNGKKQIAFCGVDHLGFTSEMVQKVMQRVQTHEGLEACEVYIGSSHTHSGGGSYLDIPHFGEVLAGPYDDHLKQFYIERCAEAIVSAFESAILAKVGIGYGKVEYLSRYRAHWPEGQKPLDTLSVIKVTTLDDQPFAAFFNFPLHPTVLKRENKLFSADFVGFARDYIESFIGKGVQPIYFNGAQGDIIPTEFERIGGFEACDYIGQSLAAEVEKVWAQVKTEEEISIETFKHRYFFTPQTTPFGLLLPVMRYQSELGLIVLNGSHAFVTIPGELSCLYQREFQKRGDELGYYHVSILGLTNDAHGYIILPESWRRKTMESALSFGGEYYGEFVGKMVEELLEKGSSF